MPESFFDPGDQRTAKVQDLFSLIARRYDLINDLQSFGLHRRWKRRLIELAQPRASERALDVCCGTGDVAFALAREGANVIALDSSEAMLERALLRQRKSQGTAPRIRAEAAAGNLGVNPRFMRGDAQKLPFPDGVFDIVTVCYGLRNLASWEAGLGEMARVARPGGRLLVLDFGKPDNGMWRRVYFAYLRCIVPCLGWLVCRNAAAYSYILESLNYYPAQHGIAAGMRAIGLNNARITNLMGAAMTINYAEKPATSP